MLFSQPWMLVGLGACLIPLLIHLLSRRVYRRERWAAMRFLRAALSRRAGQLRLESLLLLLVRTVLVLLLVLAVAEPIFFHRGDAVARVPRQRILVVDLSASMGTRSDGERRIDRARREIESTLADAEPGDAFRLVRIATLAPRTLIRRETFDTDDVRAELRRWDVTEEAGDVPASLQAVWELLHAPADESPREVVIYSDFQRSNWQPEEAGVRQHVRRLLSQIASRAALRLIDVAGESQAGNLAVTQLAASHSPVAPEQDLEVSAVVRNYGRAAVAARVEWLVGGTVLDSSVLDVPGAGEALARAPVRAPSGDALDVEARLAVDDALSADNRAWLAVPVRPALRVLLLDGQPGLKPIDGAAGYVALALAPPLATTAGRPRRLPIQVDVATDADFADRDLAAFDCLWLCHPAGLSPDLQRRIVSYVEDGGGLVVAPGELTPLDLLNDWRDRSGRPLLPAVIRAPQEPAAAPDPVVSFRLETTPHPLTAPFSGNPRAGLETTRIRRYWTVDEPLPPDARRVLSFSDGRPAIIEHTAGQGRVALVLTTLDDRWGNWAVWPSFLPLVQGLTLYCSSGAEARTRLEVGEPIERFWPPSRHAAEVQLTDPAGQRTTLTPKCGADVCLVRYEATSQSGIYRLESGPAAGRRESIAVNVGPAESLPAQVAEGEWSREILADQKFEYARGWTGSRRSGASAASQGSLAGVLLAAALLLIVIEKLLAWRSNWGVAALVTAGIATAAWQSLRWNIWIAAALILLTTAAGIIVRQRLATRTNQDHTARGGG